MWLVRARRGRAWIGSVQAGAQTWICSGSCLRRVPARRTDWRHMLLYFCQLSVPRQVLPTATCLAAPTPRRLPYCAAMVSLALQRSDRRALHTPGPIPSAHPAPPTILCHRFCPIHPLPAEPQGSLPHHGGAVGRARGGVTAPASPARGEGCAAQHPRRAQHPSTPPRLDARSGEGWHGSPVHTMGHTTTFFPPNLTTIFSMV